MLVQEVLPQGQKIVTVTADDSIHNALQVLLKHNIYGAPVYDSSSNKWLGFIDLVDVVSLVVKTVENLHNSPDKSYSHLLEVEKIEFLQKKVSEIVKHPLHPVSKTTHLKDALKIFMETGTRRIAVMEEDKVVNVLTQSAIVSWIAKNLKHIPYAKKTVKELDLGFKKVISVSLETKVVEAFHLMSELNITGVAVVDNEGTLFSALSAKDIKELDLASPFKRLYNKAIEYIQAVRNHDINETMPIIYCHPETTLEEVIRKVSVLKIHRIFIVDEKRMPVGIISLGDVIKLIVNRSS